jgi:hypothetical protein
MPFENQFWQIRRFVEENGDKPDFMLRTFKFRQQLNRDTIIIIIGQKRTGMLN